MIVYFSFLRLNLLIILYFIYSCGAEDKQSYRAKPKETTVYPISKQSLSHKIVHGEKAFQSKYPTIGKISYEDATHHYFCTGILVPPDQLPEIHLKFARDLLVLTAGHCLLEPVENKPLAASHLTFHMASLQNPNTYIELPVLATYADYSRDPLYGLVNDIGILEVHAPDNVQLPHNPLTIYDGNTPLPHQATTIGYGVSQFNLNDFGTLRKTTLPIIGYVKPLTGTRYDIEKNAQIGFHSDSWLMLGHGKSQSSNCFGDSGGPCIAFIHHHPVLIAVVSHGSRQCQGNNFGSNVNFKLYHFTEKSINTHLIETIEAQHKSTATPKL
jgi:V8-like Glu-specific endopeptidase